MYGIIYCITNTVNGKQYVGQTVRTLARRWQFHLRSAKDGSAGKLHRAIRKYSAEAFKIEQIDSAEFFKELNGKETCHIARLKTLAPSGYNLTMGGEGREISEETRRKMSEAKRHITEETLKKLSVARCKRPLPSIETRQKTSKSLQDRKYPPKQFCKRNHPLDEVNTYINPFTGHRTCLTCHYLQSNRKLPERLLKYVTQEEILK